MIIALFGPPGAGKDTVGKILVEQHAYRRVAFADKVRELALKLHGCEPIDIGAYCGWMKLRDAVERFGWEHTKRTSTNVRKILERVGDGCREVLGENVWINAAFSACSLSEGDIVITDVPKQNEIDWVQDFAGSFSHKVAVWHITRDGCEKRPSDEWKPEWATATIENDGTIEELAAKVKRLME